VTAEETRAAKQHRLLTSLQHAEDRLIEAGQIQQEAYKDYQDAQDQFAEAKRIFDATKAELIETL
jgi:hypothetical protein